MRVPLLVFSLLLGTPEGLAQMSRAEIISDRSSNLEFGGNADSGGPALSADGRFVVFSSAAENLTVGITKQPVSDIYVHDRQSGVTRLLSLATNGVTGADGHCWNAQISADGSRVLFETEARNLAPTMADGTPGVLVLDVASNLVWHASVGRGGTNASAAARNALLSADGSTVVFESAALNLTTGIVYRTPETPHIFVRYLASDRTELVDVNYRNQEPARSGVTSFSSIVGINSNGTKVAFLSNGTNFVQVFPQSYRSNNLWVRDLTLGTNILVSSFNNQASSFDIRSPSMSADGTKFIYSNGRTNFFRDISQPNAAPMDGSTNLVSPLTISPDGELAAYYRWVSAEGGSSEPVNSGPRIFVGRTSDSQFVEVPISASNGEFVFSADSQTIVVTTFEDDFDQTVMVGGREIRIKSARTMVPAAVCADGSVVATEWWWNANGFLNVLVEETNRTTLISKAVSTNTAPLEPTQHPEEISEDGKFVLFTSFASLVTEDQNRSQDVYLRDRAAGTNVLVSRALGGASGNAASFMPRMTPDGEHVVFVSAATNLVENDTNRSHDVFIWSRSNGVVRLVSPRAEDLAPSAVPFPTTLARSWPVVSKDGRYVAFASKRPDLVAGTGQNVDGVYVRDVVSNVTYRAFPTNIVTLSSPRAVAVHDGPVVYYLDPTRLFSFNLATGTARGYSNCVNIPSFSNDGQRMAMISGNPIRRLSVWDVPLGERRDLFTYASGEGIGLENSVSLSGDGKRVAFVTAQALVPQDRNGTNDVYVVEVDEPRQFRLVQPDSARAALAVKSAYPSISEDGRRVSFVSKPYIWSQRSNAVPSQVYLVDLALRRMTSVQPEHPRNPYYPSGYSAPVMSPDGGLVFGTIEQLSASDGNRSVDAYYWALPASLVDSDRDELPDEWELAAFGNLSQGPADDFDNDGQSNRVEYFAGTEPDSSDSALRLEVTQEDEGEVTLRWSVVPGKEYEVLYNTTPLSDGWAVLTDNYLVTNGIAELSAEPTVEALFFRIRLKE